MIIRIWNLTFLPRKMSSWPLIRTIPFCRKCVILHVRGNPASYHRGISFISGCAIYPEYRRPEYPGKLFLNFFANLNITPNVILEVKGDQTKQNLVQAGIGQFLCRFAAFGINTYLNDLCYFSLGDPPLHWNLAVAYHKKRPPSIQAQKLIQAIHELIR